MKLKFPLLEEPPYKMRRGPEIEPDDDITDEERAIIASMIEEEERVKATGISFSDATDTTNRETGDCAGVSSYEELNNKQYVVDILDLNDPRPLAIRLQALTREREADQWKMREMEARAVRNSNLSALDYLQQNCNIEETEQFVQERSFGFTELGDSIDDALDLDPDQDTEADLDGGPVASAASRSSPFVLVRQPSFYAEQTAKKAPINPLLLLGTDNSTLPLTGRPKLQRNAPDISKKAYGFSYGIEFDKVKLDDLQPFCFQWVGEILRISGTLTFNYNRLARASTPCELLGTCKIWILSSMALFHSTTSIDAHPEDPDSERGDICFYLINSKFLGKPLIGTLLCEIGTQPIIYTINYDAARVGYYLLFYSSLRGLQAESMSYHDLVNSKMNHSILTIDTMVQVTFDPMRDL